MFKNRTAQIIGGIALAGIMYLAPSAPAQDRNRGYSDRGGYTRIEPGTVISVRTNDAIQVQRRDNRVYYGIVDQDVRGDNGRLAIPRGSRAELIVRAMPDNDLVLDMESVTVNGERYAIQTGATRIDSGRDNSLVGSIVGAISGGEVRGRAIRLPRNSLLTFRIQRPMDMGIADRGVDRDGRHYHDWYGDRYR